MVNQSIHTVRVRWNHPDSHLFKFSFNPMEICHETPDDVKHKEALLYLKFPFLWILSLLSFFKNLDDFVASNLTARQE